MKQSELKKLSKVSKQIYDYGCYFLSLLYAARDVEPDVLDMFFYYEVFTSRGWMGEDCFVKDPVSMLKYLTGRDFKIKKSNVYDTTADIVIARWYNPSTKIAHFTLQDKADNVLWDSLGNSNTVANGYIESYRLFYLV